MIFNNQIALLGYIPGAKGSKMFVRSPAFENGDQMIEEAELMGIYAR